MSSRGLLIKKVCMCPGYSKLTERKFAFRVKKRIFLFKDMS